MNVQTTNLQLTSPLGKGNVKPPIQVVLGAAAAAVNIYDSAIDNAIQKLEIQNIGLGTIKVCINDDATINVFNRILAADTGAGNGLGGTWTIDMGGYVRKVSVFSTAGSTLCAYLVTNNVERRY